MNNRRSGAHPGPRPAPPSERRVGAALAYHAARWSPLLALALFAYTLYPVARGSNTPVPDAGQVALSDVVAPFEFVVRKSPQELQREAEALAATVRPIYVYHDSIAQAVGRRVEEIFGRLDAAATGAGRMEAAAQFGIRLTGEEAAYLQSAARRSAFRTSLGRLVQRGLGAGVTPRGTLEQELSREVVVRRGGRERIVPRDSLATYAAFLEGRSGEHPAPNSSLGDQLYLKLINGVFQPTLMPNTAETEALRTELRASVDTVKDVVRADERIVAAHEVVTPEAQARLLALRAELARRGRTGADLPGLVGQTLSHALTLSVFWLLLTLYRRETYRSLRQVLVITGLFAMVIAGAAINRVVIVDGPELIPIPFATMLLTVLFSGRMSMVAAMVLAVLIGSQAVYGPGGIFLPLMGGVAGALSVRVIRRRTQLIWSFALVFIAFVAAAVALALRFDWTLAQFGSSVARGGANAVVSAALVTLALPVVESVAGLTTDLTLLELSDPSHPLLRRLATEAPGTYAHSIAMANLCEAACNAIGANGLLARVGCYYHDVGKLKKPLFFVENQAGGANPHDRLKAEVSAGIIRNHVRDGLALADEAGLPAVVKAFIPEHHGTSEITYFLERARARARGAVAESGTEPYRYPGPRPQSVETAVALLADGVEAALRVLDDPTPEKISHAIDHLIQQRMAAGQLAEAPLTLAQLSAVRDQFVRVLGGMHHGRIDYPTASGGIHSGWEAATRA